MGILKQYHSGAWESRARGGGTGGSGGSGTSFTTNSKVTMSGDQTVTTSTWTKIAFNTVAVDTDSEINTTNYTWTATNAGTYIVIANVVWQASATGVRSVGISETGIAPVTTEYQNQWTASSAGTTRMSMIGHIICTAGQAITIWGWQNSGGNLVVDSDGSYFSVFRIA
jgi:hypothetical protein